MIPLHGLVLGLVIAAIAPFGDFGESMIKRSFKTKDSGTLLMDHGGILDRIDSALWAVPIGYYLILFFLA
jgi:phosphatidate cytidylyltransferase